MTATAPTTAPAQATEEIQDAGHVDVLIVGAGVSGIGAAYHLRDQFPDRTFVILDAQNDRGGTWSTEDRRWTVDVTRADTGERLRFTTDFLWMCQGYYNHEKPYQPRWEGMERFRGRSCTRSSGPTTSTTPASAWS